VSTVLLFGSANLHLEASRSGKSFISASSVNSAAHEWELDLDSSLFRQIPVGGERQFQFRIQAFNLPNNVVLGEPNNDINSGPGFRDDKRYCK
jgi:hypothetical protein